VPPGLANDSEFQSLLDSQITSASSIEQNYYATKDSHYSALVKRLPEVQDSLAQLRQSVVAAQASLPGNLTAEFRTCTSAINMAAFRAKTAAAAKANKQYGDVSALLSVDQTENRLEKVMEACIAKLDADIDSGITASGKRLDSVRQAMESDFAGIDQTLAKNKAAADILFIRRTLHTLFNALNIYSISPVAVFDVAYIGPKSNNLGGTRLGPGGGVRFQLASSINFTTGYAWNVNSRPGEGHGAVFFAMAVRDLFSF